MNFKVISYYCDVDESKYYEKSYHRLKTKLDEYGYDYHIEHLDSLGSYKENCRRKIDFIIEKMNQFDDNLLWLDIDTILLKRMDQLENLVEGPDLVFAGSSKDLISMKASPILFINNENSRKFLQGWKSLIDTTRENGDECFDHEVMFKSIFDAKDHCTFAAVGYEYCTWPGHENEDTVILMGLSDVDSKKESLRKMGFQEGAIDWQTVGLYNE